MTTLCLSIVLAVIAAEPQPEAPLMLPNPADWRFERINFPLSFAPELKYEGFEELRFAPGMFKPESDTYFTYVFAMKITSETALGPADLQSLLETYYRGLCRTVAKEKKFDIDVATISAQLMPVQLNTKPARRFQGTISCFDPFVTGKPISLNLEMVVIDVSGTDHRIFAAVSPKSVGSPIWNQLRTLKDEFQERCAQSSK